MLNDTMFPTLEFAGGRVQPFQQHHLTARYVSWLNDPEVVRFSEQRHRTHTLASCRAYFESFTGSADRFLAIEAQAAGLGHIGNISIAMDRSNLVADVSILVGEKQAWGTGLASKAWCGVLAELLERQGLRKVTAGTLATNHSMLRLMERSGMRIEAVRQRQMLWEGAEVDMVFAARFAQR